MDIYNINDITLNSIIRVPSECKEGERIYYGTDLRSYELIYCLNGEHKVIFQGDSILERTGMIRYLPKKTDAGKYYVDCIKTGECIDIFFDTKSPVPDGFFSRDYFSNPKIDQLFVKIHNTWTKKQTGYYNKCLSLFFAILSEMQKTDFRYSHKSHKEKNSKGVEYIHNHYYDADFDYYQLAKLCEISYTYFKKLFNEIYNVTPSEYVKTLRLQNACELLSTHRFSISQIAVMCGFENIYYFSKVFKEAIGVPPSEYERQL